MVHLQTVTGKLFQVFVSASFPIADRVLIRYSNVMLIVSASIPKIPCPNVELDYGSLESASLSDLPDLSTRIVMFLIIQGRNLTIKFPEFNSTKAKPFTSIVLHISFATST
ncbi:hypothetical protein M5689_006623 [Euphorbia peplus]|nr:hypothetical protein M5689_006623 [Euphorbia peplus]